MTPHVHADLIKAWADGADIECLNTATGKWQKATMPSWLLSAVYRIKDPYRELKEAAADPTKQVRIIGGNWMDSGFEFLFESPPEDYEIRDKPKAKVKMWQWVFFDPYEKKYYESALFYSSNPDDKNAFCRVDSSMIEVEE